MPKKQIIKILTKNDLGKEQIIFIHREIFPAGDIINPDDEVFYDSIITAEGLPVNKIDNTTFQISSTGEILHLVHILNTY